MKIRKSIALLFICALLIGVKIGSAFYIGYLFQSRFTVKYNVEPNEGYITPYKAVQIALLCTFSYNIKEITVFLDTYPEMDLDSPTYGVEIMMNLNRNSNEGNIASVKVDARTGMIKDISYGRYVVDMING